MRPERYNVRESEAKWRKAWADAQIFKTENDDPRPKYYVLEMFPYPSGRIHMGHVRNYAMGDVVARYRRARGFNVLHPMGWDAFGLPAENAAIQNNTSPAAWTYANIAAMRAQLQSMGLSLDWSREIATCDPSYYKHQQKLFLDFLDAGLVARKKSKVNWDPVDQTVLANEQVIDGRGWRSGAIVEQRELTQWFLKITDYSDDLLASLDRLDRWPEKVRLMQKNWIGRSEGLAVRFVIDPATLGALKGEPGTSELDIYTTRPDTLFGAKFMAIAPDHPLAAAAAKHDPALKAFIEETRKLGTSVAAIETAVKRGYDTGLKVVHPFDPEWRLPIYVANFVLMEYGAGAIFGCPAHDQRDLDFVRAYGLGVTPVVCPPELDPGSFTIGAEAYEGNGVMINSRFLDGMTVEQAKEEVSRRLEQITVGGRPQAKREINYKLRDWGVSRQRYWGCPIPIIHCETCGVVPVPVEGFAGQAAGGRHLRSAGQPAQPPSDVEARRLSAMRSRGDARDRHDGHVRRFILVLRALHRSAQCLGAGRSGDGRPLAGGRPVYRRHRARDPASSLFALLHPRHAQVRLSRSSTNPSPASSPRAWWCTRPIVARTANGSRRRKFAWKRTAPAAAPFSLPATSRSRSARTRRCRSPGATPSIRTRSSRPMAPTRRDGSCSRTRRPSVTSSGPRLASRARSSRRSACGA